jgi:hypothetical protein
MLNMSNGHSFLRADSERRPIPDRALATEHKPVDPEGQINPSESATAKKPEIAAASSKS